MGSVPVDQHVLFDDWGSGTGLECFDVWYGEFEMGRMVKSLGISTRSVVSVRCIVWADVVRFSVIVPSDDLEELEVILKLEDLFPSVVPKGLGIE
jgi:hypothetical protein